MWGALEGGRVAGYEATIVASHFPMKLVRMRKTNLWEWFDAVQAGKLTGAIKTLNPAKRGGPYTVLCDGEGFLHAKMLQPLSRRKNIVLWQCPAKSPDLNPVEMFWGWMRKKLRKMDMADLRAKRAPLDKAAYTARIKSVMRSAKAQQVAKAYAKKLSSACQQVIRRKGAAADN